jgi:hypothetical protein
MNRPCKTMTAKHDSHFVSLFFDFVSCETGETGDTNTVKPIIFSDLTSESSQFH